MAASISRFGPRPFSGSAAIFLFIAILANGMLSCAQEPVAAQAFAVTTATAATLEQMTRAAGVVFAGKVVSVQRPAGYAGSAQDAAEGIVVTQFRVDEAVRGCAAGSIYTLREWAGLWVGRDRYRTGQRLLVFLHAPDGLGLSSAIDGAAGVIPLRGGGTAPGPYDASAIASNWAVDLRWVEAQAARAPVEPGDDPIVRWSEEQRGDLAHVIVDERTTESELRPYIRPEPKGTTHWTALPSSSNRSMPSLAQVLSLCRAWESTRPGFETAPTAGPGGRSSDGTP